LNALALKVPSVVLADIVIFVLDVKEFRDKGDPGVPACSGPNGEFGHPRRLSA